MRNKRGFTLVELLVVIAIISILAAIVVPRVSDYIKRGRMAKALAEIKGVDLALTKMLADSGKQSFNHFFSAPLDPRVDWERGYIPTCEEICYASGIYTNVFYILLRKGREAIDDIPQLKPEVAKKLATSYMDLGLDPWGTNSYKFYFGQPLARIGNTQGVYFRSYRTPLDPADPTYIYNDAGKDEADRFLPGNPAADGRTGFPAPKDLPVYVLSVGADEMGNQGGDSDEHNGGDDINNWDNASGWEEFY